MSADLTCVGCGAIGLGVMETRTSSDALGEAPPRCWKCFLKAMESPLFPEDE